MNTPHDDMPEHDPQISALYRKTGDIAPPASLDEAILASARRAVRRRRQRWILPLSTAAVLMLGLTVLLKINSEWQAKESVPMAIPDEEKAEASAGMLAKKAAPASPAPQALNAAPPQQAARAKTEIAESFGAVADAVQEMDKQKESETLAIAGTAQAEPKALEPKPWIEKIRKLIEEKKLDEGRKELQAFRKRYPDFKLPDDLKSLVD